jgi:hypothetical protein
MPRKLELSAHRIRLLSQQLQEVRGGMMKQTGISCDDACTAWCVTEGSCACTHP